MRAWILESLDGIEKLKIAEVPDPRAEAGEVVLRMILAGLNPADRYLAQGQYPASPSLPHILGRDGLGAIESLGAGVDGFKVGDEVAIVRSEIGVSRPGTFAQRVAVPVESLVHRPGAWSQEQSAGATLVYLTAYQAITQWTDLETDLGIDWPQRSVVLITGATGGVGVAGTQLAKAMGHTVIGLSRSEEKSQKLRTLGADAVFDPSDSQWRQRVKEFLAGRRVDLAIDNIGGEGFSELLDTLGENGRVSCVGALAGPVPQFNTASLLFRRIQIRGVAVGAYTARQSQEHWQQIVGILTRQNFHPVVDSIFEFDRLLDAFQRLQAGPMGKVLLRFS